MNNVKICFSTFKTCLKPNFYQGITTGSISRYVAKKVIIKIGQIEAGISTFEVHGSKWNILLPGTSSLFLPAGDVGGEINVSNMTKNNALYTH